MNHIRTVDSRRFESTVLTVALLRRSPAGDYRRRPVLYTTITQADVVEKIIRLRPHHHFGPMKIGMSVDRSPACHLPASVTHLDLAKRPTGVGNRIPVLSVPAVRRERH
jgi:hypothetical protein